MEQFTKDKKRTAVVLLSLAASLSVYLCIVTMLDSQAARTIVSNYMDTDMVIQNDTACKENQKTAFHMVRKRTSIRIILRILDPL